MVDLLMVAVAAGVLAIVAYTSLAGFLGLRGGNDVSRRGPDTTDSQTGTHSPGYDIDRIISAHLFGETRKQETVDVVQAPETKLQLRLMGLIASADERYARALIGVNAGDVSPYGVGDSVDGTDATIRSVEPKRVLLDRHGAVESLYLKLPELSDGGNRGPGVPSASGDRARIVSQQSGRAATPAARGMNDSLQGNAPDPAGSPDSPAETADIPYGGVKEPAGKLNKLPF